MSVGGERLSMSQRERDECMSGLWCALGYFGQGYVILLSKRLECILMNDTP